MMISLTINIILINVFLITKINNDNGIIIDIIFIKKRLLSQGKLRYIIQTFSLF